MTDDTTNQAAHPPAITTSLFRINYRLGTLFAFASSQDGAAEMFVAQWAALLGDAPGDFSIDRMVRFKRAGRFMQSTQSMQSVGRDAPSVWLGLPVPTYGSAGIEGKRRSKDCRSITTRMAPLLSGGRVLSHPQPR